MANPLESVKLEGDLDQIRMTRKSLEAVLEQCHRALELLSSTGCIEEESGDEGSDNTVGSSSPDCGNKEADEVFGILKLFLLYDVLREVILCTLDLFGCFSVLILFYFDCF